MGGVGLLGGSGGAFAILRMTAGAAFGTAFRTSPSTFAPFGGSVREVEPPSTSSAMTRAAIRSLRVLSGHRRTRLPHNLGNVRPPFEPITLIRHLRNHQLLERNVLLTEKVPKVLCPHTQEIRSLAGVFLEVEQVFLIPRGPRVFLFNRPPGLRQ